MAGSMIRLLAALSVASAAVSTAAAQSADPIRIGFGTAITGLLAANGKSALLAQKIWEEDVNAQGGLLGRPVKLVYYDDQTISTTVPGIYTKLLDVDRVDLIVGGYGAQSLAAAMPLVMQRNKVFIGLLGLAVNNEFNYPNYFSINPAGPDPKPAFTRGFFDTALTENPKPHTVRSSALTWSSHATPLTAHGRTPGRPASISSTTRPIRRTRPTSPQWCARFRRPIPISW